MKNLIASRLFLNNRYPELSIWVSAVAIKYKHYQGMEPIKYEINSLDKYNRVKLFSGADLYEVEDEFIKYHDEVSHVRLKEEHET